MTNPQPNPVRTLESHGVIDQTGDRDWSQCLESAIYAHHMKSIKTNSELVPYVEQCASCGWVDGASLNWWAENAIKNQLSERAKRMALASDQEPFKFVQPSGYDLEITEILGQALGAASTCWTEKALVAVGEFDSSRARAVFEALYREVERYARLEAEEAAANERTRLMNIIHAVSRSGSATPIRDILVLETEDRNPVNESKPTGSAAPLEAEPDSSTSPEV